MDSPPVDQHRDPVLLARLNSLAGRIFAQQGLDFSQAARAGGWTNATWLTDAFALRLAVRPGGDKLRREAGLGALLPAEVGYPPPLAWGELEGHEWCLSRRAPGRNLGELWLRLGWAERISAWRQLWDKVLAVQRVDTAAAAPFARQVPWFGAPDLAAAVGSLERFAADGLLNAQQVRALAGRLADYWAALPGARVVLNHGDLTTENALWQDGRVTALLDFEFAVIAPPQIDLAELVLMAFAPGEREDPLPDPRGSGLAGLRGLVVELARPLLATPQEKALLLGYAVMLQGWLLGEWLAHPEGEGPLETWAPYRTLLALAEEGAFLGEVLE